MEKIRKTKKTPKGQYWLYKCHCGNEKEIREDHVRSGRTKSCGCRLNGKTGVHWKGYQDISSMEYTSIKYNAKKRGIKFELKIEDIWNIYISQNKKCALSGKKINFNSGITSKNPIFGNASIDRINNNLSYFVNNCWILDKNVNAAKLNFDIKFFLSYIKLINNPIKNVINKDGMTIFKKHKLWSGIGNISGHVLWRYKHNAKTRNIPYDISDESLWDLYLKQNGCCVLTGMPIYFYLNKSNYTLATASLDRIDSSKGYVKSNIQWVHKDINRMKWCLNNEDFKTMAKNIYNNTIKTGKYKWVTRR